MYLSKGLCAFSVLTY